MAEIDNVNPLSPPRLVKQDERRRPEVEKQRKQKLKPDAVTHPRASDDNQHIDEYV
ncbi:MAG: hypothetical protein U1F68_04655 [Gammaproteobacteria bacterium]